MLGWAGAGALPEPPEPELPVPEPPVPFRSSGGRPIEGWLPEELPVPVAPPVALPVDPDGALPGPPKFSGGRPSELPPDWLPDVPPVCGVAEVAGALAGTTGRRGVS